MTLRSLRGLPVGAASWILLAMRAEKGSAPNEGSPQGRVRNHCTSMLPPGRRLLLIRSVDRLDIVGLPTAGYWDTATHLCALRARGCFTRRTVRTGAHHSTMVALVGQLSTLVSLSLANDHRGILEVQ